MALNNLKAMQKEKTLGPNAGKSGAQDFDIEAGKKPALLKRKPVSMPAKKSGLASRLTGGK